MGLHCPRRKTVEGGNFIEENSYIFVVTVQTKKIFRVIKLQGVKYNDIENLPTLKALYVAGNFFDSVVDKTMDNIFPVNAETVLLCYMRITNRKRNKYSWLSEPETSEGLDISTKISVQNSFKLCDDHLIYGEVCDYDCTAFLKKVYADKSTFTSSALLKLQFSSDELKPDLSFSRCAKNAVARRYQEFFVTEPTPGADNVCPGTEDTLPYSFHGYLQSTSRKMVVNLYEYYTKYGMHNHAKLKPLATTYTAVGESLNLHKETVRKIVLSYKNNEKLVTPKRKRVRNRRVRDYVESFEIDHIKRIIQGLYSNNIAPNVRNVMNEFLQRHEQFHCSVSTFRKILLAMNFRTRKIDRRASIGQRHDIVVLRQKFVKKMLDNKALPDNEQGILIYIDETWIDTNARTGKGWMPKQILSFKEKAKYSYRIEKSMGSPRLIVLSALSPTGIIKESISVYPVSKSKKTENYHDNVNSEKYSEWFEKLLKHLSDKRRSTGKRYIIVMDNAPYHSSSSAPLLNSKKEVILEFLNKEKNILITDRKIENKQNPYAGMILPELRQLVKYLKQKYNYYRIDALAKEYSIELWRQPPWNPDLNAIEYSWSWIKRGIRYQLNQNLNIQELVKVTEKLLNEYGPERAKNTYNHVMKLAQQYRTEDGEIFENLLSGPIIINTEDSSEESEDEEDPSLDDDLLIQDELPPSLVPINLYEEDFPNEDVDVVMPVLDPSMDESELAMKLTYDLFHKQLDGIEIEDDGTVASTTTSKPRSHKRLFSNEDKQNIPKQKQKKIN